MSKIGSLFLLVGLASIGLHFFGYTHKYLAWVDNWGTEVGWAIRGGVAVLGLILLAIGGKGKDKE